MYGYKDNKSVGVSILSTIKSSTLFKTLLFSSDGDKVSVQLFCSMAISSSSVITSPSILLFK